jgi:hypothetical protein
MTPKPFLAAGLAAALLASHPAAAASSPDRELRVGIDKAEVISMASAPAVVLVANPQIADVVVEQGHLIFIIGKRTGETRLYVYGANGRPLIERDVVVVPPADHAVTIIRDTFATDYTCDPRCVSLGPVPVVGLAPAGALPPGALAPAAPAPATPAPPAAPAASPAPVASVAER